MTQFSPMIEHKNVPSIDGWWKFWTLILYTKCSSIGYLLNIDWFNHWSIIGPWSNYWHDRSSVIVWWWAYIPYLLFGYIENNLDIAQSLLAKKETRIRKIIYIYLFIDENGIWSLKSTQTNLLRCNEIVLDLVMMIEPSLHSGVIVESM